MALRVCSGLRTIPTDAALVLKGISSIDLQVDQRVRNYLSMKLKDDQDILNRWKRRWKTPNRKANWTKTLIPRIETWIKSKPWGIDTQSIDTFIAHPYVRQFHSTSHVIEKLVFWIFKKILNYYKFRGYQVTFTMVVDDIDV